MNILQAKNEIKNSIMAYLMKDEFGQYQIPAIYQRPVLLMGPPGIGKTAIMEQIARECQIGLVAYTITHHTRQSAMGLPYIVEKEYNGEKCSVTEYTMSEIIGSVYDYMEKSGLKEGILFIDEINCVSETLTPMMLQFLQGKSFGNHKVPNGWVIVAAGNPPEYNKSVREFDIVTLDRVKKIDVVEDFEVWKKYAYQMQIHSAIMTYLEIKKENFYSIESTIDGKRFVTARGWEDLSRMIYAYEKLGLKIEEDMIIQYVQNRKIAKDFANYYDLYAKYENQYNVEAIIAGQYSDKICMQLNQACFDEKVSVIGLLVSRLNESMIHACRQDMVTEALFEQIKSYKNMLDVSDSKDVYTIFEQLEQNYKNAFDQKEKTGQLSKDEKYMMQAVHKYLLEDEKQLKVTGCDHVDSALQYVKDAFMTVKELRLEMIHKASDYLNHVFVFLEKCFGESQEMVIFLTELNSSKYVVDFIQENGCETYFKYNKSLLFGEQRRAILSDLVLRSDV